MSVGLRYPKKCVGSWQEQMEEMRNYLIYLVRELEMSAALENTQQIKEEALAAAESEGAADTGWISLGLSENVSEPSLNVGNLGGGCYYRVVNGNHVYVFFNCKYNYDGSDIHVNKNKIPKKYRPKNHVYTLNATGGRAVARCLATSAGNVAVEWIQQITATANTTASTVNWVYGYIDYFI